MKTHVYMYITHKPIYIYIYINIQNVRHTHIYCIYIYIYIYIYIHTYSPIVLVGKPINPHPRGVVSTKVLPTGDPTRHPAGWDLSSKT